MRNPYQLSELKFLMADSDHLFLLILFVAIAGIVFYLLGMMLFGPAKLVDKLCGVKDDYKGWVYF